MDQKKYIKYLIGIGVVTVAFLLLSWRRKAANAAVDFLDVMEIGNNQGWSNKVFEQMMKESGWKTGEAWCMYFAKNVYLLAFPARSEKINSTLTGSTQQSWKNAQTAKGFKVITSGSPKPGDIVIWQNTKNSTLGHAGIVKKNLGNDMYETVEGNSSLDGAREGQGVVKGNRKLIPGYVDGTLKVLGFIRMELI